MTDPVKEYKDLNESWNISAVIKDIKNSYDAEVISDLFRISASLITTIESQKEEIEKAVAEAKYQVELTLEFNKMHTEISLRESDLNDEIDRYRAITELTVKSLKLTTETDVEHFGELAEIIKSDAISTLAEIKRLSHAQT